MTAESALLQVTNQIAEAQYKTIDWFVRDVGASERLHIRTFPNSEDMHIYDGDVCKAVVRKKIILSAANGTRFAFEMFKL